MGCRWVGLHMTSAFAGKCFTITKKSQTLPKADSPENIRTKRHAHYTLSEIKRKGSVLNLSIILENTIKLFFIYIRPYTPFFLLRIPTMTTFRITISPFSLDFIF